MTAASDRSTVAPPGAAEARPLAFERVVFFSDAVFAIAITLLALDLRLPQMAEDLTSSQLNAALVDLTPKLFGYALGFVVIGQYWLVHWRRFLSIRDIDGRLAAINLLQLGFVAILPFPTSLLAEDGDLPAPVVLYALTVAAIGLSGTLSWLYAIRAGLVEPGMPRMGANLATLRGLTVPAIFLLSLPLILVHPYVAAVGWLLILPAQRLLGWYQGRRPAVEAAGGAGLRT